MATPQDLITTVNGRRCTRSRARTAVTSTLISTSISTSTSTSTTAIEQATIVTPTELTTSTLIQQASLLPTTAVEAPPPPPSAETSTSTSTEQPAVAPTTEATATSAPAVTPSLATSSEQILLTSQVASSAAPSLVNTSPQQQQPAQSDTEPQPLPVDTAFPQRPRLTTSARALLPTGDSSAGIIAPEQGPDDSPLTLPKNNDAKIGGIVGGVIGGVAALALITGLLFFCLRKRKVKPLRWDEKKNNMPRFMEKIHSIPAGMGVLVAKLKGKKAGPIDNPYQRHTVQSSVGSVYSTHTNGRVRSTSEPHGASTVQRSGSVRSTSSKKSERNLLRKKQSSISDYRFPAIAEDIIRQNNDINLNPFSDPEPPRALALLNPDPRSQPVTPLVPAATPNNSRDPFASPRDRAGDGADWRLPAIPFHRRNISSLTSLSSHPPSMSLPIDGPSLDTAVVPPAPTQAVVPAHPRPPLNTLPSFNTTSSGASRESNYTFFGEPGPSRPGTNLFTPGLPTGRTVRQSDPFDLDRPEVLGFGEVLGRKEVRGSVTRQGTRSRRTSSFGNWFGGVGETHEPYDRDSAKPRPLWSAVNKR
ncbi:hypothetical protein ACN47E_003671 [Coniothyrium glycines]